MLDEDGLGAARSPLHPVDHDNVGPSGDGKLHIVLDAGGAELDVDRLLPASGLPELFDLDAQVVGASPVGMSRSRPLVDARGKVRMAATRSLTF